jgi:hypothetical protein
LFAQINDEEDEGISELAKVFKDHIEDDLASISTVSLNILFFLYISEDNFRKLYFGNNLKERLEVIKKHFQAISTILNQ